MCDLNFHHFNANNPYVQDYLPKKETLSTYKQCITQIKEVYISENDENNHDSHKHNIISQILRTYYKSEERLDLFEGFLHLLVYLHKMENKLNDFESNKLSIQALNTFYEYVDKLELLEQDNILNNIAEDKENFVSFLKFFKNFNNKTVIFKKSRGFNDLYILFFI